MITEMGEENQVGERTPIRAGRQAKKYCPSETAKFSSITI